MSLPRARAALKQMNRDTEHLRLLAIFHYVAAGLAAFFSFFPLLYATIGGIFIFVSRHGTPKPGEELPPEFVGWIFVGLGLAVPARDRNVDLYFDRRTVSLRPQSLPFALVVACIECLFIPFGTILGVFTIVALSRESARALFSTGQSRA